METPRPLTKPVPKSEGIVTPTPPGLTPMLVCVLLPVSVCALPLVLLLYVYKLLVTCSDVLYCCLWWLRTVLWSVVNCCRRPATDGGMHAMTLRSRRWSGSGWGAVSLIFIHILPSQLIWLLPSVSLSSLSVCFCPYVSIDDVSLHNVLCPHRWSNSSFWVV